VTFLCSESKRVKAHSILPPADSAGLAGIALFNELLAAATSLVALFSFKLRLKQRSEERPYGPPLYGCEIPQPTIPPVPGTHHRGAANREREPFSLSLLGKEDSDDSDVELSKGMYDALLARLDKMQRQILSELHYSEERLAAKLTVSTMFKPVSRISSAGRVSIMSTDSTAPLPHDGSFVDREDARSRGSDGFATDLGTSEFRDSLQGGSEDASFANGDNGESFANIQVTDGFCVIESDGDIEVEDNHRLSQAQAVTQMDPTPSKAFAIARSYKAPLWAKRIMTGHRMEYFFGILILANGIMIGLETELAARDVAEGHPKEFFYTDLFFVLVFAVELALRLTNEGIRRFYCKSDNRTWAYIDTFIVAVSILQLGLEIKMRTMDSNLDTFRGASSLRALRIVRLLRLVRILRFTRLMHFARALRTMVHQLLSTLKSLFWAVLLLMMIIYLFAILFTQAVTAHAHDVFQDGATFEEMESLQQYWKSIPVSMLSLYMAITGGINWKEVIEPLSEVGTVYTAIFIGYIILAQLAVLNILTGVFCQNAIESAAQDADLVTQHMLQQREMFVKRLETLFSEIDVDHSGTITLSEFQRHLTDARVQAYFEALELDSSNVWTLFKLMDEDQGNRIDMHEFVTGALKLRGAAKCVDLVNLKNDHNWMVKKMTRFMKRTDEALKEILRNSSSVAFLCPAPNIEAQA